MNRLSFLVVSSVIALAAATASAQELNLATLTVDRPDVVSVRTGLDHAFVGEIGYRRVLAWGERQILLGGDFELPTATPDLGDYRARLTAGLPLGTEHWKITGWLDPTLRGTRNVASDMMAVGADLRLVGGYYARRWFLAGEAGVDWVASTRITFSDAYRSRVYGGARDGWYRTPGGTTYAGLQGGVSFSSFDVVMRAGQPRTTSLATQTIPLYVTLGVNVALP